MDHIPRSILPVPPAPALCDQLVVDVGSIREECIGHRAPAILPLSIAAEIEVFATLVRESSSSFFQLQKEG
jgi:hypothetical protein